MDEEFQIYHRKYNFWFNHESPGHANLHTIEKWRYGKDHYVMNNYEHFIERYTRRIHNFREYLKSGTPVEFIMNRYNVSSVDDVKELDDAIRTKYPDLQYSFRFIWNSPLDIFRRYLVLNMNFDENDDEVLRLS